MTGNRGEATEPPEPPLDLEGVRRRDPEALGALFERYFDRIYALVLRLLGEKAAAEDAVQETFLKIHRGAHQLDPSRDPGPWVFSIATNVCRDHWRTGAHKLSLRSVSTDAEPALGAARGDAGPDPERDLLAAEREAAVRHALARLREPLREVLLLRDYEGFGYEEMAAILGVDAAVVRKRHSRALVALGRLLEGAEL